MLSSSATIAVLGAPDSSLVSLTEMAEQTRRVSRASNLPVLVDGEQGFGNALNAMRTVEEIEAAGAAAVTIEDTMLPRAYGAGASLQLVSEEEGVSKMKAALLGRKNPGFVVLARTSALSIASLEEALSRITSYEAAGVDAVFLSGVKSVEQLNAARASISIPIVVGAVAPELRSVELLRRAGVSLWAQGNLPLFEAAHAMHRAYADILQGKREAPMQNTASDPLIDEATRGRTYDQWLEAFC
jgi:oxaloacetate decarboxylase